MPPCLGEGEGPQVELMAGMWGESEGEGKEGLGLPLGFALSNRTNGHGAQDAEGEAAYFCGSGGRISASIFTLKPASTLQHHSCWAAGLYSFI